TRLAPAETLTTKKRTNPHRPTPSAISTISLSHFFFTNRGVHLLHHRRPRRQHHTPTSPRNIHHQAIPPPPSSNDQGGPHRCRVTAQPPPREGPAFTQPKPPTPAPITDIKNHREEPTSASITACSPATRENTHTIANHHTSRYPTPCCCSPIAEERHRLPDSRPPATSHHHPSPTTIE
ncbi:hypothetical protein Dimus_001793, partial [Dionaea muscipula]